ncbi:mucin-3A-like isoform X2 [Ambystoma mexicanum]|uniref:mucin-3A-like isoform X2 n=1 Tax=Ambystoma mexicanum TaxID=8296 RepID=UPI0037E8BA8F
MAKLGVQALLFFCIFSTSDSQNNPCQNGGTYDNAKCICTPDFWGQFCEHPVNPVPTTYKTTTTTTTAAKPSTEVPTTFKTKSTTISTAATLSPEEFCRQNAPVNYSQFYFPYFDHISNTLTCVNHCTKDIPGSIDCNYGTCELLITGPQCFCSNPNIYWYSGERCNSRVNKLVLGVAFAAIILVLLTIILALSVLLCKSNRRSH